jgi:hypothetical protein
MARKRRLRNPEDRKHVGVLLKHKQELWQQQRLIALKLGFDPDKNLEEIEDTVGCDQCLGLRLQWVRMRLGC